MRWIVNMDSNVMIGIKQKLIFGGKFAMVKRDARLDLVFVLIGPILLQAFAGEE